MIALRQPTPILTFISKPKTWHGGQSRYHMLPAGSAQRNEFDTHRPVDWKHRILPLQIGDLETRIEQLAQEIADGEKAFRAAQTTLADLKARFQYGAFQHERHNHQISEAKWDVLTARGRLTTLVSEGKRLTCLLIAYRERLKEGRELGL